MTVKDAAKALGMTELSAKMLMQQGRLNIGDYIKRDGKKNGRYHVVPGLLEAEVKRRSGISPGLSDEDVERIATRLAEKLKETA